MPKIMPKQKRNSPYNAWQIHWICVYLYERCLSKSLWLRGFRFYFDFVVSLLFCIWNSAYTFLSVISNSINTNPGKSVYMILVIPFQKHSNTSYPRDNLTKLMFNSILDYPYTIPEASRIYIISFFYTCPIHASAIIPLCNAQLKMIFIFPFILFFYGYIVPQIMPSVKLI